MNTGDNSQRPLPYSEDMEKSVLPCLWLDLEKVSGLCRRQLQPAAFNFSAHRIVYELLLEFSDRHAPADFQLVKEALKEPLKKVLNDVDVPQFLNGIYSFLDTAANAQGYIDGVRDRWARRIAIPDLWRQIDAAYDIDADTKLWDP